MVVLIDTNIILDVLQKREPFYQNSKKVLKYCAEGTLKGYIAPHSISNIFFVLRKEFSISERKRLLCGILDFLTVSGLGHEQVREALLREDFPDFEDCLQDECAVLAGAEYIITRNTGDFKSAKVEAAEPEQLLELLEKEEQE